MKHSWPRYAILRAAALLAPGDQRGELLRDWQSELWYVPPRAATRFCLGAFRDALWLRRNNLNLAPPLRIDLHSPLRCLLFLAAVAVLSLVFAAWLPVPHVMPDSHLRVRGALEACLAMLMLSCGVLPATWLAMGRDAANPHPLTWAGRRRLAAFLALKIVLVQPVMMCAFLLEVLINPVAPIVAQLAASAIWFLTFRWVLADQQRRCPVCLRLLTHPVRIGAPSQTFLAWYGAESVCARGHGLLHTSEISASHSEGPQWLRLDSSWSGLFTPDSARRQA